MRTKTSWRVKPRDRRRSYNSGLFPRATEIFGGFRTGSQDKMPTSKRTRDAPRRGRFSGTVTLIVNSVFVLWIVIPDNPRRLASWDMLLITGILALILGL